MHGIRHFTRCVAVFASLMVLLAAGPAAAQSTGVFTVYGNAWKGDFATPPPASYSVRVENLTSHATLSDTFLGGEGGFYAVSFVDYTGNRAAALGDLVQVTLRDALGNAEGLPTLAVLPPTALLAHAVRIDVNSAASGAVPVTWAAIKRLYR